MDKIKALAYEYDPGCHSGTNVSLKRLLETNPLTQKEFQSIIALDFHTKITMHEIKQEFLPLFEAKDGVGNIDTDLFVAHFLKLYHAHMIQKKQKLMKKYNINYPPASEPVVIEKKDFHTDYAVLLVYKHDDEVTLVNSLKRSFQIFFKDQKIYFERLQGFKGPSIQCHIFRDFYFRVFGVRISFPEVGIIFELVNQLSAPIKSPTKPHSATNSHNIQDYIDGPKFLVWFYKIARLYYAMSPMERHKSFNIEFIRRKCADSLGSPTKGTSLLSPNSKKPFFGLESPSHHRSQEPHMALTDINNLNKTKKKSLLVKDHQKLFDDHISDTEFLERIIKLDTAPSPPKKQPQTSIVVTIENASVSSQEVEDEDEYGDDFHPPPLVSQNSRIISADHMEKMFSKQKSSSALLDRKATIPESNVSGTTSRNSVRVGEDDWSHFNSTELPSITKQPQSIGNISIPSYLMEPPNKSKSAPTQNNNYILEASEYFPMYSSSNVYSKGSLGAHHQRIQNRISRERTANPFEESRSRISSAYDTMKKSNSASAFKSRDMGYLKRTYPMNKPLPGHFFFPSLVLGAKEIGRQLQEKSLVIDMQ